jgi:hypothetical protein
LKIKPATDHRLGYRRGGYLDKAISLRANGSVADPPGSAECGWRIEDDGAFVFLDTAGQVTARLEEAGGRYRGVLLADISSELYDLSPPEHGEDEEMRYILGIPHVNCLDLLYKAVESIPAFHDRMVIVDNSDTGDLRETSLAGKYRVVRPPVPLTFTQTQNLLQKMARVDDCGVIFFMHSDGEAAPGSDRQLLEATRWLWRFDSEFGVAFTNYDVLCSYNVAACEAIGPWDTVFTQYHADVDYYGRMKDAGFQEISTGIEVYHHGPSATLSADPHRRRVSDLFGPVYHEYLKMKHGLE